MLWLGFGGLLVCIAAGAAGTILSLDRVHQDEKRIRKEFLGRMGALDQIRSQIFLSGTYVRDFLLSPDPSGAAAQTSRMGTLEHQSYASLEAYSHLVEANEREPFQALQSEIDAYWRVLDRIDGVDAGGAEPAARILLLRRVDPAPERDAADRGPDRDGERARARSRGGAALGGVRRAAADADRDVRDYAWRADFCWRC